MFSLTDCKVIVEALVFEAEVEAVVLESVAVIELEHAVVVVDLRHESLDCLKIDLLLSL